MRAILGFFTALLFSASALAGHHGDDDMRISVQLWSVRDMAENDFKGTLRSLKEMGFDGVELAGLYGGMDDEPEKLKAFLDEVGLKVAGAHVPFSSFEPENLEKTLHFFKTIGCDFLIIGWDERAWNPEKVDELIADLNRVEKLLTPHGMRFGYHNHDGEFGDFNGSTYWDHIAENVSPNVYLQLDVAWVTVAGKDPVEYVKKYPGRTLSTHYKSKLPKGAPEGHLPIIGKGVIDWPALIKANKKYGGTEWYTVEQEDYPNGMTSLEAVEASFEGLKTFL